MTGPGFLTAGALLLGLEHSPEVDASYLAVRDVLFVTISEVNGNCQLQGGRGDGPVVPLRVGEQARAIGPGIAGSVNFLSPSGTGERDLTIRLLPAFITVNYHYSVGDGGPAGGWTRDVFRELGVVAVGRQFGLFAPIWWTSQELARCDFASAGDSAIEGYLSSLRPARRKIGVAILTEWAGFNTTSRPRYLDMDWDAAVRCERGGSCHRFASFIASR
jgi:hypothetical protein